LTPSDWQGKSKWKKQKTKDAT